LEREFGVEPLGTEIRRYPAIFRLGLLVTGSILGWVVVLGVVSTVAAFITNASGG
jgi:hypothetical protein